jgi:plastocyanin
MPVSPNLLFLLALAGLPLAVTACGDDEEAGPELGAVTSDEDAYGSRCRPVGEQLAEDATATVDVQLDDYTFLPEDLEVAAGITTFAVENVGGEAHELAFLPGGGDVPFTDDGTPDEAALAEAAAFELEAFPAGEECTATYDLEPGRYTLFCIVEAPNGATHYEKGMRGTLTVR